MNYFECLKDTMTLLSQRKDAIFLGQAVNFSGTAMYNTLSDVPPAKRYEMPVAENMQLGMSIGLALQGVLPVSIFPRWNFLLSATDQLVNHLDKISVYSGKQYCPKVIIRVGVGSNEPLNPGPQHLGDFSHAFREICPHINIIQLHTAQEIIDGYEWAINDDESSILVEYMDLYNT